MDHAAVAHRATAEYIYQSREIRWPCGSSPRGAALTRPRCSGGSAARRTRLSDRETAIRPVLRDRWQDCHEAEIVTEHISAYIRYCFRLRSGSLEL